MTGEETLANVLPSIKLKSKELFRIFFVGNKKTSLE